MAPVLGARLGPYEPFWLLGSGGMGAAKVFENEALRVLNVNIDAGDTTLDHTHVNDIAIKH